jgi:anti-sigma regulatory factor (Ser/Thr protein kinase)
MYKTFKRDMASLDALFAYVEDFVTGHKIDDKSAHVLNLAIEEIFTNLVKYDAGAEPDIPVGLTLEGREIVAVITNTGGHEFDITKAPDVDINASLADRPVGGLGIHLVQQLVDDITYRYTNGTGVIKIVKRLEDGSV